ncbi:MAG: phenylalanine--tRNA ligase subunit beta [Planctomycetes bacterium]|nr:phenylalanine--tRNA ligase subunit beta [Planctomycetota bacterium]
MHLSLNWLSDHVDLTGLDVATIAHELTMRSALIEGFVDQAAQLPGVVVGEVLQSGRHPDADRLTLNTVAFGADEPVQVVCGAPNVAAGQKIVYAPVGTALPNGLKLKKAKIRGTESHGMICAEDEIGLGPEHDGILVLDPALPVGTPIGAVPGLTDVVFEIDNKSITHRPDLWGHHGFARELAAIFGRELRPLDLDATLRAGDFGPRIERPASDGCALYAGLCVDDVPTRSPDWLRFRLVATGMRPINLLVDLSNYVMLDTGQPTHPFDRDRIRGDRIVVRRAEEGERLVTLDGEERILVPDDLMIADGEGVLAIAGIMGGADAEVGDGTRRVFLESASFDCRDVRRTSSRLGLRTEALARFEKALDPALVEVAVRRYAALLRQIRPEATVHATYRIDGRPSQPDVRIPLRREHVSRLLGYPVAGGEVERSLEVLGFEPRSSGEGTWDVGVPSWRATRDVSLPEDLIEEVGRVLGYDRVPSEAPRGPLLLAQRDPLMQVEETLRDALAGRGAFTEILAYSTIRDRTLSLVGGAAGASLPRLANALQQDASHLRPSVVPELLGKLEAWLRYADEVRSFEVGRGYRLMTDATVHESREVCALLASTSALDARDLVRRLRGVLDLCLEALSIGGARVEVDEPDASMPWMHARRSARALVGDRVVARFGAVAPDVLQRFDVEGSAGLLVLDVRALAVSEGTRSPYVPVSRFPEASIDLAFVADYRLGVQEIEKAIRAAGPRTLRRVASFDVYRGAPLSDDERSIAFHLVFQASDRTLTDKEVVKARERIVSEVEKLGARLR